MGIVTGSGQVAYALLFGVPPLQDRPFVHFTHVSNLPGVVASGFLKSDSLIQAESVSINECGNAQIKERRRQVRVNLGPGGVVADYVPFYFATRSPMMYSIHRGNVPTYAEGQEPLVYLWSYFSVVDQLRLPWIASDGNCAHSVTSMFNTWELIESSIDWQIMKDLWWRDTAEDGDRMRRRMAELLVYQRFPFAAVRGVSVKTERVAALARSYVGDALPLHITPDWYY